MLSCSCLGLIAVLVCLGMIYAAPSNQEDEQTIRRMVDQAVSRLNKGDVTAFEDFWDQDADYVGVDGRLITGRAHIQAFFGELAKSSAGQAQQASSIERIRFLTPELAIVDGSWTVTGARDDAGKELPPIKGRGVEIVQKREGQWRFVATREMVVFKGNYMPGTPRSELRRAGTVPGAVATCCLQWCDSQQVAPAPGTVPIAALLTTHPDLGVPPI